MKQKNNSSKIGFDSLENKISQVLKPIFAKVSATGKSRKSDFMVLSNLQNNWQKIVGENCWQFCSPKKIKFEKNKKSDAVLTIGANNSSVAFYLDANTNQIVQNIASLYGYKIVGDIRIIQEPRNFEEVTLKNVEEISVEKQNFINKSTSEIKDEGLRLVLQKLGKSILK